MAGNIVDVDVRLVVETDKAYLFQFDEDKDTVWIPKSQCEYDAGTGVVTLPETLALDKGMI